MSISFLELIGYLASIVILISIAVNSIVKFRILNALGALIFSIYGFIIGAYPVGFLNGFITLINAYYLYKMFSAKETFDFISVDFENPVVKKILEHHGNDILYFFPGFEFQGKTYDICLLMLRNMQLAGLFLAHYENENTLYVDLDYVTREYRDMKNGKHLYRFLKNILSNKKVDKIIAKPYSPEWVAYLKRLGFKSTPDGLLEKTLVGFS